MPDELYEVQPEEAIDVDADPVVIFKMRFASVSTETYGLILAILNKTSHELLEVACGFSHYPTFYDDLSLDIPWHELLLMLDQKRFENSTIPALSQTFETLVREDIRDIIVDALTEADETANPAVPSKALLTYLTKVVGDESIQSESALEAAHTDRLQMILTQREQTRKRFVTREGAVQTLMSDINAPQEAVFVESTLLLSPVSGIPVYDLESGEEIVVKVSNNTTTEKAFHLRAKSNQQGKILPSRAVVEKKKLGINGECALLLRLDSTTYSKVLETEAVKVKRYQKELTGVFNLDPIREKQEKSKRGTLNFFLWFLAITGAVGIAAVAIYLYFLL